MFAWKRTPQPARSRRRPSGDEQGSIRLIVDADPWQPEHELLNRVLLETDLGQRYTATQLRSAIRAERRAYVTRTGLRPEDVPRILAHCHDDERLDAIMLLTGMEARRLSELTGISQRMISYYRHRAVRTPPDQEARELAHAFTLPVETLFPRTGARSMTRRTLSTVALLVALTAPASAQTTARWLVWTYPAAEIVAPCDDPATPTPDCAVSRFEVWGKPDPTVPDASNAWLDAGMVAPPDGGVDEYGYLLPEGQVYRFVRACTASLCGIFAELKRPGTPGQPSIRVTSTVSLDFGASDGDGPPQEDGPPISARRQFDVWIETTSDLTDRRESNIPPDVAADVIGAAVLDPRTVSVQVDRDDFCEDTDGDGVGECPPGFLEKGDQ